MKIVNLALAVMFLLFAFVQVNDPDPALWIIIYGSMAVVCVMAAYRIHFRWLNSILVGLFSFYAYLLLPGIREWLSQPDKSILFDDIAKMQHPYVEESREFLGLMICIIVLILHVIIYRKPQIA